MREGDGLVLRSGAGAGVRVPSFHWGVKVSVSDSHHAKDGSYEYGKVAF